MAKIMNRTLGFIFGLMTCSQTLAMQALTDDELSEQSAKGIAFAVEDLHIGSPTPSRSEWVYDSTPPSMDHLSGNGICQSYFLIFCTGHYNGGSANDAPYKNGVHYLRQRQGGQLGLNLEIISDDNDGKMKLTDIQIGLDTDGNGSDNNLVNIGSVYYDDPFRFNVIGGSYSYANGASNNNAELLSFIFPGASGLNNATSGFDVEYDLSIWSPSGTPAPTPNPSVMPVATNNSSDFNYEWLGTYRMRNIQFGSGPNTGASQIHLMGGAYGQAMYLPTHFCPSGQTCYTENGTAYTVNTAVYNAAAGTRGGYEYYNISSDPSHHRYPDGHDELGQFREGVRGDIRIGYLRIEDQRFARTFAIDPAGADSIPGGPTGSRIYHNDTNHWPVNYKDMPGYREDATGPVYAGGMGTYPTDWTRREAWVTDFVIQDLVIGNYQTHPLSLSFYNDPYRGRVLELFMPRWESAPANGHVSWNNPYQHRNCCGYSEIAGIGIQYLNVQLFLDR